MKQDYYSALVNLISASKRDDPQLRRAIYEMARNKLREKLNREIKTVGHIERARELASLESAIKKIENEFGKENIWGRGEGNDVVIVPASRLEIIPPAPHLPALSSARYEVSPRQAARSNLPALSALVAVLGAVTYAVLQEALHEESQPAVAPAQNISRVNDDKVSDFLVAPNIPVPSGYGIYALNNGRLTELEPLPIRVPDQRVAISGVISSPSSTRLPNGRIQFVAYRRDLVNNAPQKVVVRVVAQIIDIPAGSKESAVSDNVSWAVRNTSYEMKVTPVKGKPEMILIHAGAPNFLFPPGRYGLVLKAVAYDFSVDGPITDPAQCIQRNNELDAPIVTQCLKH